MKVEWNISMFHYRNHGAGASLVLLIFSSSLLVLVWEGLADMNMTRLDVGKVLIGVQVPSQDYPAFDEFLETLGYPYVEETNNEVYTMFLRS